jgi:two-component system, chemotaxis family, CheB/CheR fusion protein
VRPELRFELRSALNRVFEQRATTLSLPIVVRFNGASHRVHLQVKPIYDDGGAEPRGAVVMFVEGEAIEEELLTVGHAASDDAVRRLSQELELTQSRLRTVREESDAANEELRAANEELQSINEEYRSTSEELETSKAELQSINEELQTVNSELKIKLEAISRAHSDLQNLVAATDIGTLFLDAGLRIKRFTDRITELFRLTPADEGRPITDFAHQLQYEDLVKDARAVLADLTPIRREIRTRNERWFDLRIRPYRTVDDKIDGVVLTFLDVSERHKAEQALRESEQRLRQERHLVELSHDSIFVWDFDGGILEWNRGSQELYGHTREEALGHPPAQLLGTAVPGSTVAEFKASLVREGSWSGELRQRAKDGRELIVQARLQLDAVNGRRLVIESTRDVTAQQAAEQRQRLMMRELTHRVRNMLTVVQAIARYTLRSDLPTPQLLERFEGRLAALAGAHTLLVQSEWLGTDLEELARQQLGAHAADDPDRIRLEGAPIMLPPDIATPLGLVLHELATNAAKHGALSNHTGRVTATWTTGERNNHRALKFSWTEENGPAVRKPETRGFGSTLIDNAIPGAEVEREFRPDGFVCIIEVPLPAPGSAREG